ncbi:class I SAM-dependent methyltransferase [Culicoidibacter larvae]|uniref:Class I SAM-dependent methyltransferase n=1 Tax=Culicoidibacter larvae TaxID=2579976 RepID=A0A5R8QGZ6_9FIRM|nr:class I SAM-dependent methyltransferase [Culicoidibacter larvae]TLG77311.1 class I SAM-dependent methyltransferase [Culicoidibacter larvae]
MNKQLLKYMATRPQTYAPSTEKFWDDEYISAQMLKAHLNPDADGATRSHAFVEKSARWIAGLADNSRLLDLGCGPGIYATIFAEYGFAVTGIDFSARSIAYAKKQNPTIDYFYQNYLDLEYVGEFDIITLIYCDFAVLPPESQQNLLQRIYRALKPGGKFIFDVFSPVKYAETVEQTTIEYMESGYWRPEPYICIKRDLQYTAESVYLEQYLVLTEDKLACYNLWNMAFTQSELEPMLGAAGFATLQFYDDISGSPYTELSETICVVAEKL